MTLMQIEKIIKPVIDKIWRRKEIAEEEIGKAISRHPGKKGLLLKSFPELKPDESINYNDETVYRGYCQKVLDAIANRKEGF